MIIDNLTAVQFGSVEGFIIWIIGVVFASGVIYATVRGDLRRNTTRIKELETFIKQLDDIYVPRRELDLIMRPVERELHAINETVAMIRDYMVNYTTMHDPRSSFRARKRLREHGGESNEH